MKALLQAWVVACLSFLPAPMATAAIRAGVPAAATPATISTPTSKADLNATLGSLARRARPGVLGVEVLDLQSGAQWRVNADRAYPMMSVFKAPVAATVLSLIDGGKLSYDQTVDIVRADLQGGPLTDDFHGERMSFSVRQLLTYAVSRTDNTAVNALIKLVGGPATVTAFLRAHGIDGMRVDIDEATVADIFDGLGPGDHPPANETPEQKHRRLQHGYAAYLSDPRNRSTPAAAADFLRKVWHEDLLSHDSTKVLIDLMTAQTLPSRLRLGLPPGVALADKCGTSTSLDGITAAYNDIGVMTWPDGRSIVIAAFLTGSTASKEDRDALFAELAREVAATMSPDAKSTSETYWPLRSLASP